MRVMECNECGETLQAANDEELATQLQEHLSAEHGEELSEDDALGRVREQAYDALDS